MTPKMKLEDIVWGKRQWELLRIGGQWAIPCICGVMEKTPRGFSLQSLMPFDKDMADMAAEGWDVPKTKTELLSHQRQNFNLMKEHFEAAGLDFDDPKNLLGKL